MPGTGICIVLPSKKGFRNESRYGATRLMFLAFQRLLQGRGASGFDVCDLTEVVARRALTASSADVVRGKYPNAPYHSYIYPYWGWFSGLDGGEHVSQSPVNLPSQWTADIYGNADVHHYVYGYVDPSDVHLIWPDGTSGPGLGPQAGAQTTACSNYCEEFTCTIAGKTARIWHGGDKTVVATVPPNVTPILANAAGEIASWTYKNKWHYWNANSILNHHSLMYLSWYGFILWTMAHMTKVRGKRLWTNRTPVWIDVDDVCRKTIPAWYARGESDPQGIRRFALAAKRNGFGKVNVATEAVAASLAGSPSMVAALAQCVKERLVLIHPHSHDVPAGDIVDPRKVTSDNQGAWMIQEMWENLENFGLPVTRQYLSMPANVTTEFLNRGASSLGVQLIRGGDWVGAATLSSQPNHIGAGSGIPAHDFGQRRFFRTGHYSGIAVDSANYFYNWSSFAAKFGYGVPQVKAVTLSQHMREILAGSDQLDASGFPSKTHFQPACHLVMHPNATMDGDIGVDLLNWLGEWNAVYPFYYGMDSPIGFAMSGS